MIIKTLFYILSFPNVFGQTIPEQMSLPFQMENQIPEDEQIALKIIKDTAKTLEKRYAMHQMGIGMSGEKLKYLEITFEVRRPLTIDVARLMLIECANEFLNNINKNEEIKPYLIKHPFDIKDVGIIFYITDKDGYDLFHPNICVARCTTSAIVFRTNDPDKKYRFKENYEETHEEAIAIVNKQKSESQNKSEDLKK